MALLRRQKNAHIATPGCHRLRDSAETVDGTQKKHRSPGCQPMINLNRQKPRRQSSLPALLAVARSPQKRISATAAAESSATVRNAETICRTTQPNVIPAVTHGLNYAPTAGLPYRKRKIFARPAVNQWSSAALNAMRLSMTRKTSVPYAVKNYRGHRYNQEGIIYHGNSKGRKMRKLRRYARKDTNYRRYSHCLRAM